MNGRQRRIFRRMGLIDCPMCGRKLCMERHRKICTGCEAKLEGLAEKNREPRMNADRSGR